jgi:PHP family Zn ribbon phosphoesterase
MLKLSYDLHIHSCLSPCGDEDMTPANIVNMAMLKELDIIAVTDHNSCLNCPALLSYADSIGIIAVPGMELCTIEEVHVLCLFSELNNAMNFSEYVMDRLVKIPNNEAIFGKQQIYDEDDRLKGTVEHLLINATDISCSELAGLMERYEGVHIPAHIDKGANSLISNLGFIPEDSAFSCFEMTNAGRLDDYCKRFPYLADCRAITNSDAHTLERINEAVNFLEVEDRSREAVITALKC